MEKTERVMEVVNVRNNKIMAVPAFREFLERALLQSPWGIAAVDEVGKLMGEKLADVLVGFENSLPAAMSVILYPSSALDQHPQVIHIYNEGSHSIRRALVKETADAIAARGYATFWAVNYSGRTDELWLRAIQPEGWNANRIGTLMEFENVRSD